MKISLDSYLSSQPLTFSTQLYPKQPWYPKTGMPCGSGCGATGKCIAGTCQKRISPGTVFSGEVIYQLKSPDPSSIISKTYSKKNLYN